MTRTTLTQQQMLKAIKEKDSTYDQHFIYGVVTTGIYCLPSCSSRLANVENIRYFETIEQAQQSGFRACKRCQKAPINWEEVAKYIQDHVDENLSLKALSERSGLSPTYFQRAFKAAFGVSPKVFHEGLRMQQFKKSLKNGGDVTQAIYETGFSSPSRVYGETMRNIGMTPNAYRSGGENEIISYACCETVLGQTMMAATEKGVCFVQFAETEEELLQQLQKEFPNAVLSPSDAKHSPQLQQWIDALNQHLSLGSPQPSLPLDMRGTAFQVNVWRFLLSVKEGEVLSYKALADKMGKPKAVRAVASACAKNRIGVLIPCHRILRSDGGLGGYRWGIERKRELLDTEREKQRASASNQ